MTNKAKNTLTILNALSTQFGYDVNLQTAMTFIRNIDACIAEDPTPKAPGDFDFTTSEGRKEFAMQGECADLINADNKIQAIKVVRQVGKIGLLEAKEAVDAAAKQFRRDNPF